MTTVSVENTETWEHHKKYTVYKVMVTSENNSWFVFRRYNEFYKLCEMLKKQAQKNKKGQSLLLSYFCSGPLSNKQQRLEDEPTEIDALELKPESPRPTEVVLAQSSTLTKGSTSNEEHLPSSSCSSTSID